MTGRPCFGRSYGSRGWRLRILLEVIHDDTLAKRRSFLTTLAAPAAPADAPSPPRSSKSSCLPVGNAANVRIYFLDVLGSGRSPTQLQATSMDASPIAE